MSETGKGKKSKAKKKKKKGAKKKGKKKKKKKEEEKLPPRKPGEIFKLSHPNFDPLIDATYKKGEFVPFSFIVTALSAVETSKGEKSRKVVT